MEIHGHIISYYVSIYVTIISIMSDFINKEIRNKKESVFNVKQIIVPLN